MVGSVFRGTAVIGYFSSATLASTRWDFHPPFFYIYLFIWLYRVLVVAHRIFILLRHVGSSSLSRDQIQALCIGSVES